MPQTSITFVSQASVETGTVKSYNLRKRVEVVKNCRNIGKKDMKYNNVMPKMKVDPETYVSPAHKCTIDTTDKSLSTDCRGRRSSLQSGAGKRIAIGTGLLRFLVIVAEPRLLSIPMLPVSVMFYDSCYAQAQNQCKHLILFCMLLYCESKPKVKSVKVQIPPFRDHYKKLRAHDPPPTCRSALLPPYTLLF